MKPERIEQMRRNVESVVRENAAMEQAVGPIEHWVKTAELLHLLRCARAWAELEAWLEADARRSITLNGLRIKGGDSSLLTAVEAELRASRGEAAPRPEGEMARAKDTSREAAVAPEPKARGKDGGA